MLEITEQTRDQTVDLEANRQYIIPTLVSYKIEYGEWNLTSKLKNENVTKEYYDLIRCREDQFKETEYDK